MPNPTPVAIRIAKLEEALARADLAIDRESLQRLADGAEEFRLVPVDGAAALKYWIPVSQIAELLIKLHEKKCAADH
jgi:hypothetical protein